MTMRDCYRCDRYFHTNFKFHEYWICKDCAMDIAKIRFDIPETPAELEARMGRKAYWEHKKEKIR